MGADLAAGLRSLPKIRSLAKPQTSYSSLVNPLQEEKNAFIPSSSRIFSKSKCEKSLGCPKQSGLPSFIEIWYVSVGCSLEQYGRRVGIKGQPALKDFFKRATQSGCPSSKRERGPIFNTTVFVAVFIPFLLVKPQIFTTEKENIAYL